jgi:hypothetical protein
MTAARAMVLPATRVPVKIVVTRIATTLCQITADFRLQVLILVASTTG